MELTEQEKKLFGGSKSTGNRPPVIRHGKYLLMVDRWFLLRGFKSILSDIKNFVVLKSEPILVVEDDRKYTSDPNQPGTIVGITNKMTGDLKGEMAAMNATRFMLALWGLTDGDITEDEKTAAWQRATNEDPNRYKDDRVLDENGKPTGIVIPAVNPCRGMIVGAETTPVLTKESKKWICVPNFIHIARPGEGDNSYEAAAKRWAEYEAKLKA